MELKDKCKSARLALKMSQRDFSKKINSNQTEVSFIERGFIPEDAKKIRAIQIIYDLHCEKN